MRIDILLPVYVDMWNEGTLKVTQSMCMPDVEIAISNVKTGMPSIECRYDEAFSEKPTVLMAEELERQGSQAIIVYCFNDPALAACKEKLKIPVIGLRESSIAMASLLGDNIAVVTSMSNCIQDFEKALAGKVKKVTALDMPVLEFLNYAKVEEVLGQRIQTMAEAGCDVIVLGCGSIMGLDFAKLEQKYGLPIVVPLKAALVSAQYFVQCRLSQSKITFPLPPEKGVL